MPEKKAVHKKPWHREKLTLGQRAADRLAEVAGSWSFIVSFFIFLIVWISFNTYLILFGVFDKPPYILLNLFLSCLAAIQAPVILMSQNRAAQRDRAQAAKDYYINRKAEREIKILRRDLLNFQYRMLKQAPTDEMERLEQEIKSMHEELEKLEGTVLIKKK